MAKDKINDYSTTANSNQDIGGVGILGTNAISNVDNAIRLIMKHLADWAAGTGVFDTATFCDPSDQTKEFRLDAGSITTGNTRVLTVQDTDGIIALLNVENQTVTGGAGITPKDLGTKSTGTVTVDTRARGLQYYTNGGAHTLSPDSHPGSCAFLITNNSSAGAITKSGWTKETGDSFTTTDTHKFFCIQYVFASATILSVLALQ